MGIVQAPRLHTPHPCRILVQNTRYTHSLTSVSSFVPAPNCPGGLLDPIQAGETFSSHVHLSLYGEWLCLKDFTGAVRRFSYGWYIIDALKRQYNAVNRPCDTLQQ